MNAYSYCWNSPIALEDAEGTTPQISIDLSALQPLVEGATTVIKAGLNKLAENIKKLISRYNDFLDKLEFSINHPDVVINNGLSKILGREVSIKFPLINAIRAYFGTFDIRTGELVGGAGDGYHTSDSDNDENGIAAYSSRDSGSTTVEDNNIVMAILQGIVAAIELDWINDILEFFGSSLEKIAADTNSFIKESLLIFITSINVLWGYIPDYMRGGAIATSTTSILDLLYSNQAKSDGILKDSSVVRGFGFIFALIGFCDDMDSAGEGAFSKKEDTIMNIVSLAVDIISLFLGPVASILVPIFADLVIDITALRINGMVFMY